MFAEKESVVTKGGFTIKATKAGNVIQEREDTAAGRECKDTIELLENDDGVRFTTRIPGAEGSIINVKHSNS